jgi:selenocysteine lyase/cysteine desulfurase
MKIRWWHPVPDPARGWRLDLDALHAMLGPKTCLVAFPHVSNILGDVWDARAICEAARKAGARSFVDGVAYAPHHLPDVQAMGCDWYVYSTYKVFGPHMAALFGRAEAFEPLTGPNHPFIPRTSLPYKFELGGVSHEGAAMIAAGYEYLAWLAEADVGRPFRRDVMQRAFEAVAAAELSLQRRLLAGLGSDARVRLIGPAASDDTRVCTVSFVKPGCSSASMAKALNAQGFGCRFGHFYSRRLVERMGLEADDGVVRVSLAHYNAMDEVERFLQASFALQ